MCCFVVKTFYPIQTSFSILGCFSQSTTFDYNSFSFRFNIFLIELDSIKNITTNHFHINDIRIEGNKKILINVEIIARQIPIFLFLNIFIFNNEITTVKANKI